MSLVRAVRMFSGALGYMLAEMGVAALLLLPLLDLSWAVLGEASGRGVGQIWTNFQVSLTVIAIFFFFWAYGLTHLALMFWSMHMTVLRKFAVRCAGVILHLAALLTLTGAGREFWILGGVSLLAGCGAMVIVGRVSDHFGWGWWWRRHGNLVPRSGR